jgi:hypothetical protein
MKYISLVGIGLAIIGILTLDWLKVGVGVGLSVIGFLIDLFKKRGVMKDDEVFTAYKAVSTLIRLIKQSVEASKLDLNSPKTKLAQSLFYLGILDAASQATSMSDSQFLDLFNAAFTDLDYHFDKAFQTKLMAFHQSLRTEHKAFPAIMKGGELFTQFANGNTTAPMAGGILIEEIIANPQFPESVDDL